MTGELDRGGHCFVCRNWRRGLPDCIEAWASWQYHAAVQALDRFDFAAASTHLDNCLWVRPSDPEARLLAAQTARRRGDFDAADRHLRVAAKLAIPPDALAAEKSFLAVQSGDMSDVAR